MKKQIKKTAELLLKIIYFMLFCFALYVIYNHPPALLQKVKTKLREKYIANLPQTDTDLLLCDFEKSTDNLIWDVSNASIKISNEHPSFGNYAGEITFKPNPDGSSSVELNNYLKNDKNLRNWSRYEALVFHIYNPSKTKQRIILQIKDTAGNKIKRNFMLNPKENKIVIDVDDLWEKLKATNIDQFNLFLWANNTDRTFFIDDIKLIAPTSLRKTSKNISDSEFLPKDKENVYFDKDYFSFDKTKWKTDQNPNIEYSIPIVLKNSLPQYLLGLPFSGGVPFPKGLINDTDNLTITDQDNNKTAFQAKALSYWPDRSIKWALLNIESTLKPNTQTFFNINKIRSLSKEQSPVFASESESKINVDTGTLKLELNKNGSYLFNKVFIDKNNDGKYDTSEMVTQNADLTIEHNGKKYYSSKDKLSRTEIEENGPLKTVIRSSGWYTSENNDTFCKFIVRIYAYKNKSYLKVKHTFIYTGYPENEYHSLYKNKRMPKNETIDSISINIPFAADNNTNITFASDGKFSNYKNFNQVELFQDNYNSFTFKNQDRTVYSANKLSGFLSISTDKLNLAVDQKNFWQQYPKSYEINKEGLIINLWPKNAGALDLKTTQKAYGPDAVARGSAFGLSKTHDIVLYFYNNDITKQMIYSTTEGLASETLLTARGDWIKDSKALGEFAPFNMQMLKYETFLDRLFNWAENKIDKYGWYGFVDFGDTLSIYRKDSFDKSYEDWGWHPEGRHGWFNCEAVGTHTGALIQFLRTLDYKYFNFGANLSRHLMDIDTCHFNTVEYDKRLRKKIPDDYSQPGSMHRHNGDHWGGRNEETSHTNVYGIALYYYLTGDERALDVINEIGSFLLKERFTYFHHPDIAPQRSIANALWGYMTLYEITLDDKYLKAADKWANIFYHGQKYDGAWDDDYNPVKQRWDGKPNPGFMKDYTIPALIEYHKVTKNKAIAESIIKATDYLIDHEQYGAYFDASAYSLRLTGDKKYKENINSRLNFTISHQNRSDDEMTDGMIYQKAYYSRVMEFLYKIPIGIAGL